MKRQALSREYRHNYIVEVYANQSRHVSRNMQALLYGNTPHRIQTNTHVITQRNTRRKHYYTTTLHPTHLHLTIQNDR